MHKLPFERKKRYSLIAKYRSKTSEVNSKETSGMSDLPSKRKKPCWEKDVDFESEDQLKTNLTVLHDHFLNNFTILSNEERIAIFDRRKTLGCALYDLRGYELSSDLSDESEDGDEG